MSDIISKRLETGTGPIGVKGIKPISGKFKPRKCVKTVSYRGRPRYICPASGGEQAVHSLENLPVKPEDVAQKLQEVKTLSPEEQYTPKQQREHPEKIQEALFRKPRTIHYDTPHEAGPDLTHDHLHFHEPEEAKPKESDAVTAKDVKDASPKKKKKEKDEDVSKSNWDDFDLVKATKSKDLAQRGLDILDDIKRNKAVTADRKATKSKDLAQRGLDLLAAKHYPYNNATLSSGSSTESPYNHGRIFTGQRFQSGPQAQGSGHAPLPKKPHKDFLDTHVAAAHHPKHGLVHVHSVGNEFHVRNSSGETVDKIPHPRPTAKDVDLGSGVTAGLAPGWSRPHASGGLTYPGGTTPPASSTQNAPQASHPAYTSQVQSAHHATPMPPSPSPHVERARMMSQQTHGSLPPSGGGGSGGSVSSTAPKMGIGKSLYLDSDVYFGDLVKGKEGKTYTRRQDLPTSGEWKYLKDDPESQGIRGVDPRFGKKHERAHYARRAGIIVSEPRAGVAGDIALTFLGGGTAKVGAAGASKLTALIKNAGGKVVTSVKGAKIGDRVKGGILVAFMRSVMGASKMVIAEHKVADRVVNVAKNYTAKATQAGPKVSIKATQAAPTVATKATQAATTVAAKAPKKVAATATKRAAEAAKVATVTTTAAREAAKRITPQTQPTKTEGGPTKPKKESTKPEKKPDRKLRRHAPLLLLPALLDGDEETKRSSKKGERRVGGKRPSLSRREERGGKSGQSERKRALRQARKKHEKAERGEDQYSQVGRKRKFSAYRTEAEARGKRKELGKSKAFVAPFARQVLNKKTSLKNALDRVPWWMQDDLLEHVRHGKKKKR